MAAWIAEEGGVNALSLAATWGAARGFIVGFFAIPLATWWIDWEREHKEVTLHSNDPLRRGKPRLTLAAWAVGLVIGALVMASCGSTPAATPTPSRTAREVIGILTSYLHAKPLGASSACSSRLLSEVANPSWRTTRDEVGIWTVTLRWEDRSSSWEYFERTGAIAPAVGNIFDC